MKPNIEHLKPYSSDNPPTPETSAAWMAYIQGLNPTYIDLKHLLVDRLYKPAFRMLALQTILAPDPNNLPFPVPKEIQERPRELLHHAGFWRVHRLKEEYAIAAADQVKDHLTSLRGRKDPLTTSLRRFYNRVIGGLLKDLPDEEAENLFSYYHVYLSGGQTSDVSRLFQDGLVDEKWKERVAEKVHRRITNEARQDKTAGNCSSALLYGEVLGHLYWKEGYQSVSAIFFQKEIAFLLETVKNGPILENSRTTVAEALEHIEDPGIRLAFAKHQTRGLLDPFSPETARLLLTEFPDEEELRGILLEQLELYERRNAVDRADSTRKEQNREAILAALKV